MRVDLMSDVQKDKTFLVDGVILHVEFLDAEAKYQVNILLYLIESVHHVKPLDNLVSNYWSVKSNRVG